MRGHGDRPRVNMTLQDGGEPLAPSRPLAGFVCVPGEAWRDSGSTRPFSRHPPQWAAKASAARPGPKASQDVPDIVLGGKQVPSVQSQGPAVDMVPPLVEMNIEGKWVSANVMEPTMSVRVGWRPLGKTPSFFRFAKVRRHTSSQNRLSRGSHQQTCPQWSLVFPLESVGDSHGKKTLLRPPRPPPPPRVGQLPAPPRRSTCKRSERPSYEKDGHGGRPPRRRRGS